MEDKKVYFKPERVNDFFVDIAAIPHGSGNENEIRQYIIAKVQQYNAKYTKHPLSIVYYRENGVEPGERNIVLRKEGARKLTDKPVVILQAHLDMVCVPSREIFPIQLNSYKDEQGIKMLKGGGCSVNEGTTLGADNGIGVAVAMAMLTDPELNIGPIECLFTVQEEVNLGGARELDIRPLTGNKLINLDSEDYDCITYGSAGGSHARYEWIPAAGKIPDDYKSLFIEISGLTGGHSGVNINDGQANALKIMVRLLDYLRKVKHLDLKIVKFSTSNDKHIVIPNNAQAAIAYPGEASDEIEAQTVKILNAFKEEYSATDPGFSWRTSEIGNRHYMLSAEHTANLIDLLLLIPQGPLKMMTGAHNIVETSANLAIVNVDYSRVVVECSNRSAIDQSMDAVLTLHKTIAGLFGIKMVVSLDTLDFESVLRTEYMKDKSSILILGSRYPSWQPDADSHLLHAAQEVYREVYGDKNFKTEVVHAGLECGWILHKFLQAGKNIECISIGPTVRTPHSWNERLETESVQPFYDCLIKIIQRVQGG